LELFARPRLIGGGLRKRSVVVPDPGRRLFRVGSIVGFILMCGLGVLVYLSALQLGSPEGPSLAPGNPRVNSNADFPNRVEQVTTALAELPLPLATPTTVSQGAGALRWTHRRYEITLPNPGGAGNIEQLFEPLRRAAAGVTVQTSEEENGSKVQVGVDGLLTHTLMLHWLGHPPRAAIIIDNLGDDLLSARTLADIGAQLTFAVRAARPFSKEVAELANLFGREVLVQLPQGPELSAATATSQPKDRTVLLRWFGEIFTSVPHAVGVTKEPGSPLSGERTQWIFDATNEKNLFVVESTGTSGANACNAEAAAVAVACVQSDFLLGDSGDEETIRRQLDAVLQTARTRGDAVVIGHATAALAAALRSAVPAFAAAGVELVPASTVVADRSLSRH
jgi:polysaccharide deacetylase 2 family uncharacterized protein YibQ